MSGIKQLSGTLKNGEKTSRFTKGTRLRIQKNKILKVSDYTPCKTKNTGAECQPCWSQQVLTGEVAASPTNTDKGRTGKRKTNH